MWLIAGLGNPGPEYEWTRHNIGFLVVDRLAERWRAPAFSQQKKGAVARAIVRGEPCLLVKPLTYMNLSGECVQPLAAYYKVAPEHVIVVHDDIDLELGQIKLKRGGGHGGHNGVRSIAGRMGSDFYRVRAGVGRPGGKGDKVVGHVLGRFVGREEEAAKILIEEAADAVELLLAQGLEAAQRRFHTRK